ncbi:MAG: hypothetical protein ACJAUV_002365 [Flavobacteriales bacterium]|jgi:hypothetical protein
MNKAFIFCLACLFLTLSVKSQTDNNAATIVIEATIVDSKTKEPIPYATIVSPKNNKGTMTNLEGYFVFPGLAPQDSLWISYVGYGRITINVDSIDKTIELVSKTEILREAHIFYKTPFLYDLIAKSKKTISRESLKAKTYFELQTKVNDKQVELLECYFNGTFRGYDVKDLRLKNGRIALSEAEGSVFISIETSKVLNMHKVFWQNEYFPESPFELRSKKLKKAYNLKMASTFINEKTGANYYIIEFRPKKNPDNYFEGEAWIDAKTGNILKIDYRIKNAVNHPFLPIKSTDTLLHVDMEISKTFIEKGGYMYVNNIDFKYDLRYKNELGLAYDVSSFAVLNAYDYKQLFDIPIFETLEGAGDYVLIKSMPYNDFFWQNIDEFRLNDRRNKNEIFRRLYAKYDTKDIANYPPTAQSFFLDPIYVSWSENRFMSTQKLFRGYRYKPPNGEPWDMMNIEIQFYLDVNKINGKISHISKVMYDPFESFYHYPLDKDFMLFLNIYMDLLEIERRKFDAEANQLTEIIFIQELYKKQIVKNEALRQKYFRETDRGNNTEQLKLWSEYTLQELGVDNWAIFENFEVK